MSKLIDFLITILKKISDLILERFFPKFLRKLESKDRQYFINMKEVFDKRSFKGPFTWKCEMSDYFNDINEIRKSIATGITPNAPPGGTRGKSLIGNQEWRQTMEEADDNLHRIKLIIEGKEIVNGAEKDQLIDRLRDEIIRNLNPIWKKLKLTELPIPSEVEVTYQ